MKKLLIVITLLLSIVQGFAQSDSIEVAQTEAKGIMKELFMFKMAIDVLETRQLISDNELGDSVENYMNNYDNALFFKSTLDYDFFWNSVLGRKKYKVPSSQLFLDSKGKYLNNNEVGTSIDFDIVLTPNWEDSVKEESLIDYNVKITTGNYTNLAFIEYEERTLLDEAMNSHLTKVATPKKALVNEAVFEGLEKLRVLCADLTLENNININGYDISVNLSNYLPIKNDTITCKIKLTQSPNKSNHNLNIKLANKKEFELLNSTNDEIKTLVDTNFFEFKILSKAYWSYGEIEVIIMKDSENIDTLIFEVPIDTDNDYIADYWELLPENGATLALGGSPNDAAWDEETSNGCINNGDGFNKLNEYKGYEWNNVHTRLKTSRKEIFFDCSNSSYGSFIRMGVANQLDAAVTELSNKPVAILLGSQVIYGITIHDKGSFSATNNGLIIQNGVSTGSNTIRYGDNLGSKGAATVNIYLQTFRNIYQNNTVPENMVGVFQFEVTEISGPVIYEAVFDGTDLNGNGNNTDLINPFDLLAPKKSPTVSNTKADNDPLDNKIAGIDIITAIKNNVVHETGHAVGMAPGNAHPVSGNSPMRSGIGPAHNDQYSPSDINQFKLK